MLRNKWKTGTAALLVCSALLAGCADSAADESKQDADTSAALFTAADTAADWDDTESTAITLTASGADFEPTDAISYNDQLLTIKQGGTYVISGTWDDGRIEVTSEDDSPVRLVLNGVALTNRDGSAISVLQAEQAIVTVAKGTENTITDGETYSAAGEDDPNAAIFSKDDLTINGDGTLTVNGRYNNAVVSKDDLKVSSTKLTVTAKDDGLIGKDLLAVRKTELSVTAGGDGLKATNSKDADKGNVVLENNDMTITSGSEGIQSKNGLSIDGGTYVITAGGGSPAEIAGKGRIPERASSEESAADEKTGKGLKAAGSLTITSGKFQIDSSDDAIHSNGAIDISDGSLTLSTGDDGIHANELVALSGGDIDITKSYEGIEGNAITISGGTIAVKATDDGVNVSSSNDAANGDTAAAAKKRILTISGGRLYVDADGDGLDANGSIVMTGGTAIINGPESGGNGALDYDGTFTMDGGTMIASGSAGMAMASSDSSKQLGVMMTWQEAQEAGTLIRLQDADGTAVAAAAPSKTFETVFISSPDLKEGTAYTVVTGGKASGEIEHGYYADGSFSGGTDVVTAKLADSVTWLDESGVTEARSGMPGGMGPGRMDGQDPGGQGPDGGKGPGDMMEGLDDSQKEQVRAIMEKERSGELTREEAEKQLAALGITLPQKPVDKK